MSKLAQLSEEEYLAIEEAIAANARGRAFLRMRDKRNRVIAADEVRRTLRSLRESLKPAPQPETSGSTHIHILRQELQEMSGYIQQTRSEIAALRPNDAGHNRIMAATGELDAIVSATERATSDILNAAERISALAGRLRKGDGQDDVIDELEAQTTEILTACSFQDITGQRTTKVVNTLRYIEKRVNTMIEIWGIEGGAPAVHFNPDDKRPDAHLLNGPSLDGVSQDDVDALLAGLDSVPAATPQPEPEAKAAPRPQPEPAVAAAHANGAANGSVSIGQSDIDALFD
jgi:chemotaxis regulatin CheY-phosphate phosphatase CheZ